MTGRIGTEKSAEEWQKEGSLLKGGAHAKDAKGANGNCDYWTDLDSLAGKNSDRMNRINCC